RHGPRPGERRAHLQHARSAGDGARAGPPPLGLAAGVGHPLPARRLPDLHDRGRGRVEAHPLRPARGRVRAGERLLHRVLGREAPDVHDERLRRGGAGRGARHHALLRRLAGPVSPPRRLPLPLGRGAGAAVLGRRAPPGDGLRLEARLLHLAADRGPLDPAALPLRPAHAARLAGPPPGRAHQRGGVGARHRARRGAGRVSPLLFLLLAALTVASALTVVVHQNPVHSACALVLTLCLLAVFFVALDAQLVAVLQVIVYAGAIVVLFLFVIMLLNLQGERRVTGGMGLVAAAIAGALAFTAFLVTLLARAATAPAATLPPGFGETRALAERLFTAHLLAFELTSLLLLVAVVGAVALSRR